MYVCMCVCIHMYVGRYVCIYVFMYVFSYVCTYVQGGSNMTGTDLYLNKPHCAILLLESVVNFSGWDVFSNEEFDHNALFHAPRYLLFAHHSSNSQTGLNRF